jgi:hypothetical protein
LQMLTYSQFSKYLNLTWCILLSVQTFPPTYAAVTFRKVPPAQVWSYYTEGQLPTYIQWRPAEMKTPTHWNPIGRSVTVPHPVLSPSSILPPSSSHWAFTAARQNPTRLQNLSSHFF